MKSEKKKQSLDVDVEIQKLGARIKHLRIKKGYTNMDFFAYDHGFNRSQYGKYEKGKDLQYSTLIKLLNAFNVSYEDFFSEGFD
ncbi:MAG: helix-turn-helix transcriptional regulator [Chitinophagaceae bacterium]